MLSGDRRCSCGIIISKQYYEKHRKHPSHKRRLKEKRKPKDEPIIVQVEEEPPKRPKIESFRGLFS